MLVVLVVHSYYSSFIFFFLVWWECGSHVFLLMGFARRRVSKGYGFLVALLS